MLAAMIRGMLLARSLIACLLVVACANAQKVHPAVITDPVPNAAHPAKMLVAAVPSTGVTIHGVLYIASGAGPHPTLLLLHGLPGNEQNLDLAQAARRAGWNVLTMHYRGSWGSEGAFSFSNAFADVHAALAWLREPKQRTTGRVDAKRIAVVGHSMGGVLAAKAGVDDGKLIGTGMISGWNLGGLVAELKPRGEQGRNFFETAMKQNRESLVGCTPKTLTDDAFANGVRWNFRDFGKGLSKRPLLLVSSLDGSGPDSAALAAAVRASGGKAVTEIELPADHSYSEHRIALASALLRWLDGLAAKSK